MALTMTRTRTQTTLTKLAELVANVHGELEFLEGLLSQTTTPERQARLETRRLELVSNREAFYATIRQFDPEIAPENIGTSHEWQKQFGRRSLQTATLTARYKSQLHPAGNAIVTRETANATRLYSSQARVARQRS